MKHILKCKKCGKFTLKSECSVCGDTTVTIRPPKFNLKDKFADYRRKVKYGELEKGRLL